MLYKVIRSYDQYKIGSVIELNDRRANSELGRENIVIYKESKQKVKTKEEKMKRKTKTK